MVDQLRASELAREAFSKWDSGDLEGAVPLYREALAHADPNHYALGDYHGEFASVLEALGQITAAREQLELSLAVHRRLEGSDGALAVALARYFLAEHLLRHRDAASVLEVIAPSIECSGKTEWLLRFVQARALAGLGRGAEAHTVAKRACDLAPSDMKRSELRERFKEEGIDADTAG
jgi:tetratricopeptide (TPR) repeat protein